MRQALAIVLCLAMPAAMFAQNATPASTNNATPTTSPKGFVLEDATPIKLRINRTVSSADAHVGDTVDFEVLEDVMVNGVLVAPKGGLAFATVTEAQAKRRMARGGKLDINIDYVRLVDDEKAALRAVQSVKGGGHTGAMTGAIVATSLVFFPAAPFFLSARTAVSQPIGACSKPSSARCLLSSRTRSRALSLPKLTLIAISQAVAAETKTTFLESERIDKAGFDKREESPNHQ